MMEEEVETDVEEVEEKVEKVEEEVEEEVEVKLETLEKMKEACMELPRPLTCSFSAALPVPRAAEAAEEVEAKKAEKVEDERGGGGGGGEEGGNAGKDEGGLPKRRRRRGYRSFYFPFQCFAVESQPSGFPAVVQSVTFFWFSMIKRIAKQAGTQAQLGALKELRGQSFP
jgi:hypothetical protein